MEKIFFFMGFLHASAKILTSSPALFSCGCYFYPSKTLQLPSIAPFCQISSSFSFSLSLPVSSSYECMSMLETLRGGGHLFKYIHVSSHGGQPLTGWGWTSY